MRVKRSRIAEWSPEIRTLKAELLKRGWDYHRLAQAVGLRAGTIANVLAENNRCRKTLASINRALGMPIFTLARKPRRAPVARSNATKRPPAIPAPAALSPAMETTLPVAPAGPPRNPEDAQ